MKICSKCKKNLSEVDFFKCTKNKDGLQSQCKQCKRDFLVEYKNRPEVKERRRAFDRKRDRQEYRLVYYHKNKLAMNISRRMRRSIGDSKQGRHWETIVGYTLEELKEHLESSFISGMDWENYGEVWHIDHIIPVSFFDLNSDKEFKQCWDLKNLQPLFAEDNLKKSNKAPSSRQA